MAKSDKIDFDYKRNKGTILDFKRSILGALSSHSLRGFTLDQVARHLGVSRATVYNKMNRDTFTIDEMIQIANYFKSKNLFTE